MFGKRIAGVLLGSILIVAACGAIGRAEDPALPAWHWPDLPAACAAGWPDPATAAAPAPVTLDCRLTGGRALGN